MQLALRWRWAHVGLPKVLTDNPALAGRALPHRRHNAVLYFTFDYVVMTFV